MVEIEVFLEEDNPLLKIDVVVIRANLDRVVYRVREELLKQVAMNYPKEEEFRIALNLKYNSFCNRTWYKDLRDYAVIQGYKPKR